MTNLNNQSNLVINIPDLTWAGQVNDTNINADDIVMIQLYPRHEEFRISIYRV